MVRVIRRPFQVVNHLENDNQEMQKPAKEAGLTSGEAGESLRPDNPEIPSIQPLSQAKTLFSLTGCFAPIFDRFRRVA